MPKRNIFTLYCIQSEIPRNLFHVGVGKSIYRNHAKVQRLRSAICSVVFNDFLQKLCRLIIYCT
jgi:hypothetical protein